MYDLLDLKLCALLLGLKPSFSTDARTLVFVASATFSSLLMTLETVLIETPA